MLNKDECSNLGADGRLILWLLEDSGISRYHISKELDISESTLSRIASGITNINGIQFGVAHKLTEYARRMKKERLEV